jgi:hypothetical protein
MSPAPEKLLALVREHSIKRPQGCECVLVNDSSYEDFCYNGGDRPKVVKSAIAITGASRERRLRRR